MGRSKRIILMTVLFICAFSIIFVWRFSSFTGNLEEDLTDNAVFTSKYNNNLSNCGWIPDWDANDGYTSMVNNSNVLDCISPVLYDAKNDGSLKNISPKNLQKMIDYAVANNIKIYPTITLFDHEVFTPILQNPEFLERHISELVAILDNDAFDGIDLDYESTKYSDNERYKYFITELSARIHAKGKKLIITVLSKWGDDITYGALPETRRVQDWRFLSDYADYIRIMAYDYTYWRAKYPGPIGPLNWLEDIIKYAKTKIPDEKIILGVHLYSYEWSTEADTLAEAKQMPFVFMYELITNSTAEDSNNISYVYETVAKIVRENEGYSFEYQGEDVFVYQKYNQTNNKYENRVLVYIDQEGVLARKKLAARYNLAGVCYWRLGNELNLIQEQ